MDIELFKSKITSEYSSIEAFAHELGISKTAIYKWMEQNKLPQERVSQVLGKLQLSVEEIDRLFEIAPIKMYFRRIGLDKSDPKVVEKCKAFSETFFKLGGSMYVANQGIFPEIGKREPRNIASYLRSLLSFAEDEPVTLDRMATALRKHNVNLFFIPFKKTGFVLHNSAHREVAFTARKGDQILIFIDTSRRVDEALFDACHELAHVVCGDGSGKHDPEFESLANKVAQELVYPREYFQKNKELLEFFKNSAKFNLPLFSHIFKKLEADFDWSPTGMALSLQEYKVITSKGKQFRIMMKNAVSWKKRKKTIDDLYFNEFNCEDYDSLNKFFSEEIQKDRVIFRSMIELRDAAIFGRLSPRRFSEIFGIDSGDSDELIQSWRFMEKEGEQEAEDGQQEDLL